MIAPSKDIRPGDLVEFRTYHLARDFDRVEYRLNDCIHDIDFDRVITLVLYITVLPTLGSRPVMVLVGGRIGWTWDNFLKGMG